MSYVCFILRIKVLSMDSWSVNNLDRPQIEEGSNTISVEVRNNRVNKDEAIYWVAPGGYLYNKVTSYGGKLIYTILFQLPRGDSVSAGVIQPDVVLKVSVGLQDSHLSFPLRILI